MARPRDLSLLPHQAAWHEPVIMELGSEGERGIIPPPVETEIAESAGDVISSLPAGVAREKPPALPEISQASVLRHYMRLSQETLGTDISVDVGKGTCTLKYSPKVNEAAARLPQMGDVHPLQAEDTVQGLLRIMYEFEQMMKEISGMERFSFQPGGGSQAIYANACMIRAYHDSRGELHKRREVLTTVYSHPVNAACARTAGFDVITLQPGPDGYPSVDDFKRAVSDRTAGMLITNPEDTGIFNPDIKKIVATIHDAGGICAYDQANANGTLGYTRASEAGFDLCHFNLHKTFSSPHGSGGPGAGACGANAKMERFLPAPLVTRTGDRYHFDHDRPDSIGRVRQFHGAVQGVLRSWMWVLALGAEGLKEVAEIATLNNNFLMKHVLEARGVAIPYPHKRRIEQVRYTLEKMLADTGVGTNDVRRRVAEFGTHYWESHHPYLIAEPATFEPTESFTRQELLEYASIIKKVAEEAYRDPEFVKASPHNAPIHRIDSSALDDPERWATTWRAFLRKNGGKK